jgi:hypothetical protein
LISAGGFRAAAEKLSGFGKEFGDMWSPMRKDKGDNKSNNRDGEV